MASPALSPHTQLRHQLLFVDDDATIRALTPAMLTARGYDVRSAADGLEGLQVLRQAVPELVISDLRMPRMSGFEFLSIVRRKFPHMPTIAISGEFLSGTEVMGIADAFFSKGAYSPDQLCAKITELLSNPPEHGALDTPPIWVPVGPSGEVVLTCTDCLRSFPVRVCPPQLGNPMRETDCLVCGTHLRYCVDNTGLSAGATSWETCGLIHLPNPKK
ncbi:MAG TPA: response regulator [Terriglobales bacterium]|nr:response regulator [Terriglobales bacterium]